MPHKSAFIAIIFVSSLLLAGTLGVAANRDQHVEAHLASAVPQQTLLVDGNDPSCDDGTGTPAYCTIQAAVNAAGTDDMIQVAAGTYTENVLIPPGSELTITGADASSTIVDGGNAERVFRIFSSSTVTLTHLGISNGNFSLGGGIYAIQSNLYVGRSLLYANNANAGAGLFAVDSHVTIQNCAVFDNTAVDDGGGLAVEGDGTLAVNDSSVSANGANRGGGIYALDVSVDLNNSEVTDNVANSNGGGIFRNRGYLGLFDSLIQGNSATTGKGGGIATDDEAAASTLLELDNSHVLSNTADFHGGGIYIGTGPSKSLSLQSSEVSYNTTASDGGGINVEEGLVIISDSILRGNTAGDDGGAGFIYSAENNATIQNSLISGNEAGDDGGGLFTGAGVGVTLEINRSLIHSNQAGGDGGALFSDQIDLTQSTVYANTASSDGGGLFVVEGLSGYNSTLSGNLAQNQGGGVYSEGYLNLNAVSVVSNTAAVGGGLYLNSTGSGDVQKTLIAGNVATGDDGPDCRSVTANNVTSLGYNLVGIGNGCSDFLDGQNGDQVGSFGSPLEAGVLPLTDNGGYTLSDNSMIPTHGLEANSPAVDVIPVPTYCAADQTDQRGVPRTGQDGNDDGGADGDGCDIGALERLGAQDVYLPAVLR